MVLAVVGVIILILKLFLDDNGEKNTCSYYSASIAPKG